MGKHGELNAILKLTKLCSIMVYFYYLPIVMHQGISSTANAAMNTSFALLQFPNCLGIFTLIMRSQKHTIGEV